MTIPLGLRTLALIAIVAAATALLVRPCLLGAGTGPDPALNAMLALSHN